LENILEEYKVKKI